MGFNTLVDLELRHVSFEKDSRVEECDIIKVTSGVARLFYYSPI